MMHIILKHTQHVVNLSFYQIAHQCILNLEVHGSCHSTVAFTVYKKYKYVTERQISYCQKLGCAKNTRLIETQTSPTVPFSSFIKECIFENVLFFVRQLKICQEMKDPETQNKVQHEFVFQDQFLQMYFRKETW